MPISEAEIRKALEDQIGESVGDSAEAEAMIQLLRNSAGLDPATGLPVRDEAEELAAINSFFADAVQRGELTVQASPEAEGQADAAPNSATATATAEANQAADAEATATAEANQAANQAAAAGQASPSGAAAQQPDLQAQLVAAQMRNAELESERQLEQYFPELQKQATATVNESMSATLRQLDDLKKAADRHAEEFGADADNPSQKSYEMAESLVQSTREQAINAETSRLLGQKQLEIQELAQVRVAFQQNPELMQWKQDADAAARGEAGRSADNYEAAMGFDDFLRSQQSWADKPPAERLARAVQLVHTANGTAPSLGQQQSQDQIQKQQQAQAAIKEAQVAPPASMSSLSGGVAPQQNTLEAALANMSHSQISDALAANQISEDQLYDVLARLG